LGLAGPDDQFEEGGVTLWGKDVGISLPALVELVETNPCEETAPTPLVQIRYVSESLAAVISRKAPTFFFFFFLCFSFFFFLPPLARWRVTSVVKNVPVWIGRSKK
jgi:hypothetical protein